MRPDFERLGIRAYRAEICDASVFWYHTADWSEALWDRIVNCSAADYLGRGYPAGLVYDYVTENRLWHRRSSAPPSAAFPPDFCRAFTREAATKWAEWIG